MEIIKLSERHLLFKEDYKDWQLYLHLIQAKHAQYLIDTGMGSSSIDPIKPYLDARKPLYIINTHYHYDHMLGNDVLVYQDIIAHENCVNNIIDHWEESKQAASKYVEGPFAYTLPTLTFKESYTFEEDGIHLFYTPGHTNCGISVYDAVEKVLNIGDNAGDNFKDFMPELDCSLPLYKKTIQHYLELNTTYIISGHMGLVPKPILNRIYDTIK